MAFHAIGEAGKYGNGKVVVYGATFYKAELVPVQFDENADQVS